MTAEHRRCIYTKLENGIHEFVVTESSRETVDELTDYIKHILSTTSLDAPPTRYLIDNSRTDALPIPYLRTRIKELSSYRPKGRAPSTMAIVYDGFLGNIANSVFSLTMKNRYRFFKPSDRQAAQDWLLQGQ